MPLLTRPALAALAATAALGLAVGIPAATAHADERSVPGTAGAATLTGVTEPARPAFYEPPADLPTTPGTVIRQEKADTLADPLDAWSLTFDARRVMYTSTDREGTPVAVTGAVITPKAAWLGPGTRRPVIVFAPGTQGMGDRCAPSRQLQAFSEYEILFLKDMLMRGYAIAVTDYQGLGTPGSHTYMVRAAQAHAVLDMARAARAMGIPGIDAGTPVGIDGYSQGGGAAAAAAELASTYAPELPIKGVAAGAPPADMTAVGAKIDGSLYTEFDLYAAVGLLAGYRVPAGSVLNAKGIDLLKATENSCTTDLLPHAFLDTSTLTLDGRKLSDQLTREPLKSAVADNRIGSLRPSMPVLITHALGDDVIPYAVGKQLAKDWCARGADVQLRTHLDLSHVGGALPHAMAAQLWFEGRFAGTKQVSSCGSL